MSHDTQEKLVYMANQIAAFFKTQPESQAAQGVATHINKFWEPRMRRQLFELLDRQDSGLSPLVLQAAPLIRKPSPPAAMPETDGNPHGAKAPSA